MAAKIISVGVDKLILATGINECVSEDLLKTNNELETMLGMKCKDVNADTVRNINSKGIERVTVQASGHDYEIRMVI